MTWIATGSKQVVISIYSDGLGSRRWDTAPVPRLMPWKLEIFGRKNLTCNGVHQPCGVGIQRPLKLSMRKSYHEDILSELEA